jgi:hypothetical protein
MVRMPKPALRTLDTRTARPPEKRADPELLTPEHRAWRLLFCVVLVIDVRPSMMVDGAPLLHHRASSPTISGNGRMAVILSTSPTANVSAVVIIA